MIALACDAEDQLRRELIEPDVTLEHLRIDGDPAASFPRRREWRGWVEQMASDVVDSFVRRHVGEHDHAGAVLRIEADVGAGAAGAPLVPDAFPAPARGRAR